MPQDDTFVTPTMPTPTIPPVQDDGASDQSTTDPINPVAPDEAVLPPIDPLPTTQSPTDSTTFDPTSTTQAPIDPYSTTQAPVDPAPIDPAPINPVPAVPADAAFTDPASAPSAATPSSPIPQVDDPIIPGDNADIYTEVATKIGESQNVLIALSSDPSVDEMCAAIGITLYLDRLGKRATAIYSGSTPNALEFLKPEETFESTADTLQDFVIAINKEKADHLRYKLDGDYVKIYITPYRKRLSEEDLEFSYGDYNVDLVIALDVTNGIDLDAALREHGRIMHDAVIINATTGNPGKFGEIEWSDKTASSISEMVATLLYRYGGEDPIAKDEATAYLTGIVAATNRFANAKTTPNTMRLCSKLMESGANQQLVSKNITPDIDNELLNFTPISSAEPTPSDDPTKLDIEHDYETNAKDKQSLADKPSEIDTEVTKKEHTLLDDLKAAEQSLAEASAETVPDDNSAALEIDSHSSTDGVPELVSEKPTLEDATADITSESPTESSVELPTPKPSTEESAKESTAKPSDDTSSDDSSKDEPQAEDAAPFSDNRIEDSEKYSQMLQDALDSIGNPSEPTDAITSPPDPTDNPASANAPAVSSTPEINGVPEMSYVPAPEADILPPPPAPPVDPDSELPTPASSTTDDPALPPLGSQPAMQDQVYRPQAADPSAFKIPGM